MKQTITIIILSFVCNLNLSAQEQTPTDKSHEYNLEAYKDSIIALSDSLKKNRNRDVNLNPNIYKIIGPATYFSTAVGKSISLDDTNGNGQNSVKSEKELYNSSFSQLIDDVLFSMYKDSPKLLSNHDKMLDNEELIETTPIKKNEEEIINNTLNEIKEIKDVTEVVNDIDVNIKVTKPNFWKTSGRFESKFTQNYFSENWYRGGNNNTTMLTAITLKANYDNQKRLTWENTLEMRLGFITTTNDTCHNFLTNNDRIRLWSKFGVKAKKAWSYTTTLEATTQFLPSYRSNDKRKYATFLAPLDVNLSIGMDFRPKFKNNNTLSITLLPLSYKLRYIGDDDPTIHSATNMVDRNTKEDFGSKIEMSSSVKIVTNLTWNMRFKFFTSYEYAESEVENRLQFRFNKYISSELYTLWRFFDNRPKKYYDDNLGYFQFNEYFTLGLIYDF